MDVGANNVGYGKKRMGGSPRISSIPAFFLSFLLLFSCMVTIKPIIMAILSVKAFCFVPKISEWGYCLLYSLLGERLKQSACIFFIQFIQVLI